jgi:hypothetical protein
MMQEVAEQSESKVKIWGCKRFLRDKRMNWFSCGQMSDLKFGGVQQNNQKLCEIYSL